MNNRMLMLGNPAISRGLIENGCVLATSYPGTPASEILPSLLEWQQDENTRLHAQWAINEKVAFEIAYTAGIAGLRSMVSMKQVGGFGSTHERGLHGDRGRLSDHLCR